MGRKAREKRARRTAERQYKFNPKAFTDSPDGGVVWAPFQSASLVGVDIDAFRIAADGDHMLYTNNLYTVAIYKCGFEGWPTMYHLSIKRNDKAPCHDWRHFQRIKNELIGPDHEAVELYPADERLVDSANQYHLFVLADAAIRFPFGFTQRLVSGRSSYGAVQRPFAEGFKPAGLTDAVEAEVDRQYLNKLAAIVPAMKEQQ